MRARSRHQARSRSPRLNHTSCPSARRRVHDREGVVAQAPAALVDQIGEPEGDEVGVGGDVGAVDLDVIAGVGDHGQARGVDDVGHAPRELGAAGAAGENDDDRRALGGITPRVRQAGP